MDHNEPEDELNDEELDEDWDVGNYYIKLLTQGMQFEITLPMHIFDNCLLYLNIYKYYDCLTNSTKL